MDRYIPEDAKRRKILVLGTAEDAAFVRGAVPLKTEVVHAGDAEEATKKLGEGDISGVIVRDNSDFVDNLIDGKQNKGGIDVSLTPVLHHSVADRGFAGRVLARMANTGIVIRPKADTAFGSSSQAFMSEGDIQGLLRLVGKVEEVGAREINMQFHPLPDMGSCL